VLVGGDSTTGAGPVHMTMTCFGLAETLLRQSGAQPGDDVYVSGTIGDAALALRLGFDEATLATRYFAPQPRLALGL
ncbi:thiamine-phosphate kinase, partial [Staphylococcus aureus]